MPLAIKQASSFDQIKVNKYLNLLTRILERMDKDDVDEKRQPLTPTKLKKMQQDAILSQSIVLTNTISSNDFSVKMYSYLVADTSENTPEELHLQDITKTPLMSKRIIRFDSHSNLTLSERNNLQILKELLSTVQILIPVELHVLISDPRVKEMLYQAIMLNDNALSNQKATYTRHTKRTAQNNLTDITVEINHIARFEYNEAYQQAYHNRTYTYGHIIEKFVLSVVNVVTVLDFVDTNLPFLLQDDTWVKGYL